MEQSNSIDQIDLIRSSVPYSFEKKNQLNLHQLFECYCQLEKWLFYKIRRFLNAHWIEPDYQIHHQHVWCINPQ